ncbi:hypothetical protein V7139_08095 [Neobacillus drentensis]|uniref:hypothetical protein n=1 Tax=Neobacillus drentensis TaxID=220684 RepID=UPI002FFEA6F6
MNPMLSHNKVFLSGLLLLFLLLTLFSSTSKIVFAADPPLISITTPDSTTDSEALLIDTKVIVKGSYDNVRAKNLLLTAYEVGDPDSKISNSDDNPAEWSINTTEKTWTFSKRLSDGEHQIKVVIKDTAADVIESDKVKFYISGTGIVLPNNVVLYGDDLTSTPKNAKIKFTIVDENPIAQIDQDKAVKVMQGDTEIKGTSTLKDLEVPGIHAYSITFTPDDKFSLYKSFTAKLVPSAIGDVTLNKVYAKSFKFTTRTSAVNWDDYDDETHKTSSNPHGHYSNNTNMCATCHSSHKGSTDKLELEPGDDSTKNYCLACHDGTTNAPLIDNSDSKNHHTAGLDAKQQESCTTCHNPHLDWTVKNPNLLQDHYVYKHKTADLNQRGLTTLNVDSLKTDCATCHEDNMALDTVSNTNKSIFDRETFKQGYYEFLKYNKSLTSSGDMEDYSLCLSCHTNIKKFYKDKDTSQHSITAADGSKLNGFIPCAECHETHGSNNSFLLRSKFGHDNQASTSFSFTGDIKGWDVNTERRFCLQCHNGSTSLYGVTAKALSPEYHPSQTAACSLCHGTGGLARDRILSAAHGPKYVPISEPEPVTEILPTAPSSTETTSDTTTDTSGPTENPTDVTTDDNSSTTNENSSTTTENSSTTTDSGQTTTDSSTTLSDETGTDVDTTNIGDTP